MDTINPTVLPTTVVAGASVVERTPQGKVKPFKGSTVNAADFRQCPNPSDYLEVVGVGVSDIPGIITVPIKFSYDGGKVGTLRLLPLEVGGALRATDRFALVNSATQLTVEVDGKTLFVWWNHLESKEVHEVEIPSDYTPKGDYSHLAPENCYPSFRKFAVRSTPELEASNKHVKGTALEILRILSQISGGERTAQSFVTKAMVLAGAGVAPKRQLACPPGFE